MELRGATAVVTGASRGIGLAIAEALAAEGAKLVLNARAAEPLEAAAASLRSKGVAVETVLGDVGEESTASRVVDTAVARTGRLDLLVNNAGIGHHGPLEKMEPAAFFLGDHWRQPFGAAPYPPLTLESEGYG